MNKQKIPVLFVADNSNYLKYDCFDCYTAERDARNYSGTAPVIAHPPCRLFSRMRAFSTAPESEKQLGYWAIDIVRANGGIVENPSASRLFPDKGCDMTGAVDAFGGFMIKVNMNWFGMPVEKKTLLYICGLRKDQLAALPLRFDCITHTVSMSSAKAKHGKPYLHSNLRSITPVLMINWFVSVINTIQQNKFNILNNNSRVARSVSYTDRTIFNHSDRH